MPAASSQTVVALARVADRVTGGCAKMATNYPKIVLAAGLFSLLPSPLFAQATDRLAQQTPPAATTPAQPAGQGQLPPVVIEQKKAPIPAKKAQVKAPPKKKIAAPPPPPSPPPAAAAPTPVAEPVDAPPAVEAAPTTAAAGGTLPPGTVRMSPLGGSEVPIEKVPAAVSVVPGTVVDQQAFSSVTAAIEQKAPSATVNAALGNALSNDLNYRGFSASPLNGTPQGLAIYQNGVRVNEVFGDAVYWDLIPAIAISDIIIMSNNPVYGLNALGGAVNVILKDGFSFQGIETDVKGGSFGHFSSSIQGGVRYNDQLAGYVSAEYIWDDGWRDISPAEAQRYYIDLAAKGTGSEFHLNYTYSDTFLGVVGPTPLDLLEARRENVFTSPQTFDNDVHLVSLNGTVSVTDDWKVSGLAFYREFSQRRPDGNVSEAVPCDDAEVPPGPDGSFLCLEDDDAPIFDTEGNMVPISVLEGGIAGGNDFVAVDSYAYGGTLQAVNKAAILGMPNQFLIGASLDHGKANSRSQSELGILDPETLVVTGLGIIIDQSQSPECQADPDSPDCNADVTPVDLDVTTRYYGFYFLDTLDVTDQLTLTFGGRYNIALIKLEDNIGTALDGDHEFHRFNPLIGATYKVFPGLSTYAGYSEANRAPTPAELSCADPARPCLLENFLVSDPPLDQVVARTVEAGFRGEMTAGGGGYDLKGDYKPSRINWTLGYFYTFLEDDILTQASPIQGRGFFANVSDTERHGIEALISYTGPRFSTFASYSFIYATFNDNFLLASPDNPTASPDFCEVEEGAEVEGACIRVKDGDRIPLIPRHRFKFGMDYFLTPEWKIGGDVVAFSDQFFRGDEGNDVDPLSGYAVVDFRTSYQLTEHILLYGFVENVLDAEYETFGTFFDRASIGDTPVGPTSTVLEDQRTLTPGPPRAFYGGMKVRF